ncbi:MAG: DUF2299 family protein, partial [Methanomicrobiales archaeon]|nr:DUF2299 family protein [Methanomicrobiales archaeon]
MAVKMKDRIKKWLQEEEMFKQDVPDENANFHFGFMYPKDHGMELANPKNKKDMIVIGCKTEVSPEHQECLKKLNQQQRLDFMYEF